jgi:hypothetical protein
MPSTEVFDFEIRNLGEFSPGKEVCKTFLQKKSDKLAA